MVIRTITSLRDYVMDFDLGVQFEEDLGPVDGRKCQVRSPRGAGGRQTGVCYDLRDLSRFWFTNKVRAQVRAGLPRLAWFYEYITAKGMSTIQPKAQYFGIQRVLVFWDKALKKIETACLSALSCAREAEGHPFPTKSQS